MEELGLVNHLRLNGDEYILPLVFVCCFVLPLCKELLFSRAKTLL